MHRARTLVLPHGRQHLIAIGVDEQEFNDAVRLPPVPPERIPDLCEAQVDRFFGALDAPCMALRSRLCLGLGLRLFLSSNIILVKFPPCLECTTNPEAICCMEEKHTGSALASAVVAAPACLACLSGDSFRCAVLPLSFAVTAAFLLEPLLHSRACS